jgi:hypothetical protein
VVYQAVLEELKKNPEVGEDELVRMMEPRDRPRAAGDRTISDVFLGARREALFERISQEMAAAPERKREDLRRALLKSQQEIISSPLTRAFDEQFARWESISAIERFGADVTAAMPPCHPC